MDECKHFWGIQPHSDGTIHQICLTCAKDAGQVKKSGWGGSPDGPCGSAATFVDVMPERPIFWDSEKEVAWFREYILRQARTPGGYISPEVWAAAA